MNLQKVGENRWIYYIKVGAWKYAPKEGAKIGANIKIWQFYWFEYSRIGNHEFVNEVIEHVKVWCIKKCTTCSAKVWCKVWCIYYIKVGAWKYAPKVGAKVGAFVFT